MRTIGWFLFLAGLTLFAKSLSACPSLSPCQQAVSKCTSYCGPGNPAGNTPITANPTRSANQNFGSSQSVTSQQQGALNAARGSCEGAASSAKQKCDQVKQQAQSQQQCQPIAQQADQQKQSCESAKESFMSKTGGDMDASQLAQALSQLGQQMTGNDQPPLPEEPGQEPTECERLETMLYTETDVARKTSLQNMHNEKCSPFEREEGDPVAEGELRTQEDGGSGGNKALGSLKISEKEEFVRKTIGCEGSTPTKECCAKEENKRFCASFSDKKGTFGSGSFAESGGGKKFGEDIEPSSQNKGVDKNRKLANKKKDSTGDFESSGGGGGGRQSSGGFDPSYDEEKPFGSKLSKPTKASVKVAGNEEGVKEIGAASHDMFSAVTRRMRQKYMKGKLIQTRGVLFKKR